jgi:hypothetical protein
MTPDETKPRMKVRLLGKIEPKGCIYVAGTEGVITGKPSAIELVPVKFAD